MQTQTAKTQTKAMPLHLRADFPPSSYDTWKKTVEAELKGAPFDKKMLTKTYEGITLQPLYCAKDAASLPHLNSFPGFAPFVRGSKASGYLTGSWDVSQEIVNASPADFNTTARACVTRGLTGLNIVLDKATRNGADPDSAAAGEVGAGGLSVATLEDLTRALEGVDLSAVSLFVRSGASALPFAALLAALCKKQGKPVAALGGCIEMDPLGVLAHEGSLPKSLEGAYREMALLIEWAAANAPKLQTVCVHSRSWHEAGGSAVQELGFTLATAVEYLRAMNARGLEVNVVAPRMRFAFTVGSNFFMEIAKLRAARILWAQAVATLGGSAEAQQMIIHVRTAHWNKTRLDPYVNMLRTTVEAFAGAMGGCQSMQVGAFDEVIRTPDDFSQRIARNTQIILQKECDLDKVMDPAGGSWYVENLTDSLAKLAWGMFQGIEQRGGMAKAMREGYPQAEVAKMAAEKLKSVAQRRDVIVGVNQFANVKEKALVKNATDTVAFQKCRVEQIKTYRTSENAKSETVMQKLADIVNAKQAVMDACIEAVLAGATLGEVARSLRASDSTDAPIKPVVLHRLSEQFEQLRGAVEGYTAGKGARPKIHLATMGPVSQHKARADFCRGFFSVAALDIAYPAGAKTTEEAAQKALDSNAPVIVLCSTDETYPTIVPDFVKLVKAKDPKRIIILAGYPTEQVEAFKQAGVDDFVHIRVNVVEFLTNLLNKIGVAL